MGHVPKSRILKSEETQIVDFDLLTLLLHKVEDLESLESEQAIYEIITRAKYLIHRLSHCSTGSTAAIQCIAC